MPVFRDKKNSVRRLKRKSFVAQTVLILLGIELLFFASFTAFNLPTPTARNLETYCSIRLHNLYCHLPPKWQNELTTRVPSLIPLSVEPQKSVRYSLFVPQASAAIFIGYVLGWPLAAMASILYLLLGIIGPFVKIYPFAAGGGLDYYLQPSFGYLLGMTVATSCVAFVSRGERTSLRQLFSLLTGLLCVHAVGLAYLFGICLFAAVHDLAGAQLNWSSWIFEEARNLSWYSLPYDFIFSLALIGIGFPFRWLVGTLTAPDMAATNTAVPNEKLVNFRPAFKA